MCCCVFLLASRFETFLQECREEVVSPPQRVADMKVQWQQERDAWRNDTVLFIEFLVWCGVVWCGVVWCGVVWYCVAFKECLVCCGDVWRGMA